MAWNNNNAPYGQPYNSPYVEAPAPPPAPMMPGGYGNMDHHFGANIQYAEPGSPLVYPVSPTGRMSPMGGSRDNSRDPKIRIPDDRGRERSYHASHASHLVVSSGSQNLSRSNSERSRNRPPAPVYIGVAAKGRGRHGRSTSAEPQYYYDDAGKKQHYDESVYSNSSFGSRGHSRSQSKARHSRSPSCASCDSFEDHHHDQYSGAMAPYRPKAQEDNLSEQLRKVQLQLEQVHADADKRKRDEENVKLEKLRTEEIERKVAEQLLLQRKKEADAAAAAKKKADDERIRIEVEAQKMLDARFAKEKAQKEADEAEKKKIQAIIDQERAKYEALSQGRRTYTKFSKIHLCKEALDERNIAYTEESEHFLVHRVVDKNEQNYLWTRTKEIRNYYRQIQDAADKAPTVPGPNGGWVKYVQIAGQPYPIALPVTITQTPGGGQTQRVDPIKIKWTDIFRPTKF